MRSVDDGTRLNFKGTGCQGTDWSVGTDIGTSENCSGPTGSIKRGEKDSWMAAQLYFSRRVVFHVVGWLAN